MNTDKKRRKFIKATLIAPLAAGVGDAAGRLHGAPASISSVSGAAIDADRFILPLAHAGVPAEALVDLSSVSALVESVLTDDDHSAEFFVNPGRYFEKYGLDGSDATLVDSTITILVALTDPLVKDALRRRDYDLAFDCMRSAGVFELRDPQVLQDKIHGIISENIDEIKGVMERGGVEFSSDKVLDFFSVIEKYGVTATEEDLAAVVHIIGGGSGSAIMACSLMAACVVGIAALAVLYVSVAVAATVTILVGFSISAGVKVAIAAVGWRPQQYIDAPEILSTAFTGQFVKLDPVAVRNIRIGYRIAEMTKDGRMQLYLMREAIREEVTAVLFSLSRFGLIKIPEKNMAPVIKAITHYACKASGVPNHAS